MELYAAVRRSVYVEGLSERAAARRFGLARETVRKMLRYRRPPGYRRGQPARRPKLDAFTGVIDQILREDQARPKKQRHTATRIGERLRAEYGFTGGDTIVKAYVRAQRLGGQEMFVPLTHPPGDAQADFGEALVVIAGVEQKAHYLVVDLPHSDDGFVQAFPAETTEAFCAGHNAAFDYFGGVPRRIVYDNTKLAVARILGDGTRQRTQVFSELQSHYLFDARFGRPGLPPTIRPPDPCSGARSSHDTSAIRAERCTDPAVVATEHNRFPCAVRRPDPGRAIVRGSHDSCAIRAEHRAVHSICMASENDRVPLTIYPPHLCRRTSVLRCENPRPIRAKRRTADRKVIACLNHRLTRAIHTPDPDGAIVVRGDDARAILAKRGRAARNTGGGKSQDDGLTHTICPPHPHVVICDGDDA